MFASVSAASVHQENAVNMMQLDMLRLQTLQTQLGNVSMQATLVLGFVVAMLGGDNMSPLMDDSGPRCLYKSVVHMVLGVAFFLSVAACVSFCFIVVTLSAFLKQASQQSALLVSTRASVANTQVHLRLVFKLFVRSVSCFVAGFALLIWLFAGLPSRVPFDHAAAEKGWAGASDEDYISALDDGGYTITCLDRHSSADEALRDSYAYALCGLTTLLISTMCAWGLRTFEAIKRTYEPRTLLSWYAKHRRLQQQGRQQAVNKTRPLAALRASVHDKDGHEYSMTEVVDPNSDQDSVAGGEDCD